MLFFAMIVASLTAMSGCQRTQISSVFLRVDASPRTAGKPHRRGSPTTGVAHTAQDDLRPHTPLLLLFTTSAQTHIYPEIRIDAVRFLDVFLDILPDVVVAGWTEQGGVQRQVHGGRVLEGYLGIMNAGTSFGDAGGGSQEDYSA
jgi:hypothetical protein